MAGGPLPCLYPIHNEQICVQRMKEGPKDWRAHRTSVPGFPGDVTKVLAFSWSCLLSSHLMKSPKFQPLQGGSGVLGFFVVFAEQDPSPTIAKPTSEHPHGGEGGGGS